MPPYYAASGGEYTQKRLNNQNTFIKIDKKEEIKDQLRQAYNIALVSA